MATIEYFSHDYRASEDPKLMDLLGDHKMIGYGTYWRLVERCYIDGGVLDKRIIKAFAGQLKVKESIINDILTKYGLFHETENKCGFTSDSVVKRLQKRKEIAKVKAKAANERWKNNADNQEYLQKQNADVMHMQSNSNADVMQNYAKIKDKSINIKEKEIKEKVAVAPSRSHFVKPSLEQIKSYCNERGNYISAEAFFNHYESNGWKVGKTEMKDWKAAVRGWEVRHKAEHPEFYINEAKATAEQERAAEEEKRWQTQEQFKKDKQWLELDKKRRALTLAIVNGEDRQAELESVTAALRQREAELC